MFNKAKKIEPTSTLIEVEKYSFAELTEKQRQIIYKNIANGYFVRTDRDDYFVTAHLEALVPNVNVADYYIYPVKQTDIEPIHMRVKNFSSDTISSQIYADDGILDDIKNTCFNKFVKIDPYHSDFLRQPNDGELQTRRSIISLQKRNAAIAKEFQEERTQELILAQKLNAKIRNL